VHNNLYKTGGKNMKKSISRTTEIVLGVLGVISGFGSAIIALFMGGLSEAFTGDAGGLGGLSAGAFFFSILGIISIILVHKNRKFSAWGFIIAGFGILISISLAGILPAILFLIAGIMMFSRKVPEETSNIENEDNINLDSNNVGNNNQSEIKIKKNSRKKLWIIIGSVFGTILVLGIIGVATSLDGDDDKTVLSHEYYIGDTLEVGGLQYTALSISFADKLEDDFTYVIPQGKYFIVGVSVKNNDKESRIIDTSLFKLIEDDGTVYTPDSVAGDYIEENSDFFFNSLNPKLEQTGYIVFDVLDVNKVYQLEVSGGMVSGEKLLISLQNKELNETGLNIGEENITKLNTDKEEEYTWDTEVYNEEASTKADSYYEDNIELEEAFPSYIQWDQITASSTLKDSKYSYDVTNIQDWDNGTAWVEGKDGYGEGEWIELRNLTEVTINGIEFVNGYVKSEEIYKKNSRPKTIEVEFSDGTKLLMDMVDEFGICNTLMLDTPINTSYIKVKIIDVYKGDSYSDTCISEIQTY
jgi:hypothetical protein